jgi:polysaccharide chain length determinant protein (PEP-CTERM system associated)
MEDRRADPLRRAREAWRQRWTGLAAAWLICLGGWLALALIPDRFQAEARIYVDTDTLLAPLLHGIAVRPNIEQQVQIMQRTLLSRPNLHEVVRMTDLDLLADDDARREAIVEKLHRATTMRPDSARNLFRLTFDDSDPARAQRVVQALLTIFVESQLGSKRRDMLQAQGFIDQQIREYEASLQAAERRLADFRQRNMDVLEGGGTFGQRIANASAERDRVAIDLAEAAIRGDTLRAQLAATPELRDLRTSGEGDGAQARRRLVEARRQESGLLQRFTEIHPDVVAARRVVAALEAQAASPGHDGDGGGDDGDRDGGQGPAISQVPNAVHEQLRLRLADEEARASGLRRRLDQSDAEIARLRGVAQRALDIEAQFANLNRDYAVLKGNHEQLLARREQARLAKAAEERTDPVQFRVVDPPRLPARPAAPNRPLLSTAVLAAGLAAGVAAALSRGRMAAGFDDARALRAAFAKPVLGAIARIDTARLRRRRRLAGAAFALCGMALLAAYGGMLAAAPTLPLPFAALGVDPGPDWFALRHGAS